MCEPFPTRGGWNPRFGWDGQGGPPQGQGMFPGPFAYPPPAFPGVYQAPPPPYTAWPQYPLFDSACPTLRLPQPHPVVSFDMPGINMVNSTGGSGCEPGYNYVFHDEHTKIHVFKTQEPPWRAPDMLHDFAKFQVPTNTTLRELMFRFGATNPNPQANRITEVIEGGNGKWYRGQVIMGDNEAELGKTIKEIGWDATRSGREKPVIWLWVTKD